MKMLEAREIKKTFYIERHEIEALKDVNLEVNKGECLAIVGESGSGKSTLANLILGIHAPTSGELLFKGNPLPQKRDLALKRAIQLVQQNPLSSLNPKRSIGASIKLALDVHGIGKAVERKARVDEILEEVGLPKEFAKRLPAALSGGQRQRVGIARALACDPQILVLDEPTSALDVLVQARVLRLLADLQKKLNLTYVFITHDLAVVRNIADRVAVFEKGILVESGETEEIFKAPKSEYTRQLLMSIPIIDEEEQHLREKLSNKKEG